MARAPRRRSAGADYAAPAKINLYLHVTGRRHDGYHLLDSLVVFAGVGDRVSVAPAREITLAIEGPFGAGLAADTHNTVLHAARLLHEASDVDSGAALVLHKELPVASGIGGGSADAAATLRALIALWKVDIAPERLKVLALELGADVPVCLFGRPALVGGIGEEIRPAPALPPAWLVLANPGAAVATSAVFHGFGGQFGAAQPLNAAPANSAALAAALAERRNDLEAPATAIAPAIREVLGALAAASGALIARMSGSGATCFALFADGKAAKAAATMLAKAHPAWWVKAAPILSAPA